MNIKYSTILALCGIVSLTTNAMQIATPEANLIHRQITAAQYAQLILRGHYDQPDRDYLEQYSYKLDTLRNANYGALGIRNLYDEVIRILRMAPLAFTEDEVVPHVKSYINREYNTLLDAKIRRLEHNAAAA